MRRGLGWAGPGLLSVQWSLVRFALCPALPFALPCPALPFPPLPLPLARLPACASHSEFLLFAVFAAAAAAATTVGRSVFALFLIEISTVDATEGGGRGGEDWRSSKYPRCELSLGEIDRVIDATFDLRDSSSSSSSSSA